MKKAVHCSALFLILLISACSKTNTTYQHTDLVGGWQFLYAIGGFSGNDSIPADPEHQKSIWFHADSSYELKNNNQVIGQGIYSIRLDTTMYSDQPLPVVELKTGNQSVVMIFNIKNNNLSLSETHYEPYTAVYRWISESSGGLK